MNTHTTITPMKAAQLVEAAGIADGKRIIADFAAGGFVKSYALSIETLSADGTSTVVLGPKIPRALWKRIVQVGRGGDVWSSGTVHLAGAAIITGITFKPDSIDWLIAHHTAQPIPRHLTVEAAPVASTSPSRKAAEGSAPPMPSLRRRADPSAIPVGALLATIEQAMQATGLSRGTINNLIKRGTLVRRETGLRSVSIEVASIRAFVGQPS